VTVLPQTTKSADDNIKLRYSRSPLVNWIDRRAATLMLSPAILLLLCLTIFPSIYSFVLSFGDWPTVKRNAIWTFEGLANYQRLFTDPRALNAFKVTGVFVVSTVGAETLLGLVIALLLNGQRRGAGITRTLIMLPMMTTPVVVGLIWRLMFNTDVGWINFLFRLIGLPSLDWLGSASTGLLSVIIGEVWEWTPFVTLITLAALKAMPQDPVEAAIVDGASPWQILRFITLPYLLPTIGVCVLLRTIDSFKFFDLLYVLTGGGPGTASEVISLYTYKQGFNFFHLGYAAALSYVTLFVIVILANVAVFTGLFRQTR
jgi:multiple sugar transport system permease protein